MPPTVSPSVKETSPVGPLATVGTGQFRCAAGVDQLLSAEDASDVVQMQAAFAQLPTAYQEVLLLQVRWGRSPTQIASELKLTLPHVLTRLCRARQELRGRLGEDERLYPSSR